jgi:low affinity Fe/Cu permease
MALAQVAFLPLRLTESNVRGSVSLRQGKPHHKNMNANTSWAEAFRRVARRVADQAGSAWAFLLALAFVIGWSCTGPYFKFSDTWQLVLNTASSIVTFLMVFLIQNTQNRDTREIQLKLDELILSHKTARNDFMELDRLSDDGLKEMEQALAATRKKRLASGDSNGEE